MLDDEVFPRSELLLQNVVAVIDRPMFDHTPRVAAAGRLCHIAIEHSAAFRMLAESRMFAGGFVVTRAQFETTVRAVWALYAATDTQIDRVAAPLAPDTERSAKNLPQVQDMLDALAKVPMAKIPFEALSEFKTSAWGALNSYTHSGIHPLSRLTDGYPFELIIANVKVSNALMMLAAMHYCVLTGIPGLQKELLALNQRFANCLPLTGGPP